MCPFGAWLVWLGADLSGTAAAGWLGACLAFAAGSFLCISLSDLLPELHFHRHDRVPLSIALLCGVLLALVVGWFEPSHVHLHPGGSADVSGERPATVLPERPAHAP
jgi:zinc and cadmium transporter